MIRFRQICCLAAVLLAVVPQASAGLAADADALAAGVTDKVVEMRRHLHEHPELSNREVETSRYVAAWLEALGYQVQTGVARYGVVAVLKGGKPGPVVALRADMDGLPVA